MTLWPISMLSRIFDPASITVPASQAGGRTPANNRARPPTSSARWALITRRMYVASRSPRSATTRSRSASSSAPKASAISGVIVTGLPPTTLVMACWIGAGRTSATFSSMAFSTIAVMAVPFEFGSGLERESDVADGGGDADLHVLLVGRRDGAGGLAAGTGVADAHPASTLGRQSGRLGLLEKRATVVDGLDTAVGEGDRS